MRRGGEGDSPHDPHLPAPSEAEASCLLRL